MGQAMDTLQRRIMGALDDGDTVTNISERLGITDGRVLWHLEHLGAAGYVRHESAGGRWRRTPAGDEALRASAGRRPESGFPGPLVHDYEQAIVEARAGMYGADYVQRSGEHGSRMSHAQAAEFGDRLLALVEEYFGPGGGDRSGVKYGFHWLLTPVDLHPLDDRNGAG